MASTPAFASRLAPRASVAYVTPAHQFALGATMPVERRLTLLSLVKNSGAYVLEDDYDSEFRFVGQPVPALQSLDRSNSVILMGIFNKVLFSSLRLGYLVVPQSLVDRLLALRHEVDRYPPGLSQAILCDFIVDGHFARHIRRMRELYAARLEAIHVNARRYLAGMMEIPRIEAGLSVPAHLQNGLSSKQAFRLAASVGIESMPLDRFALRRRDLRGLLLGFAAFTEREIRDAVIKLARVLGSCSGVVTKGAEEHHDQ